MEVLVQEQQLENALPVAWQHNKDLGACMIELYDKKLWTDVKFRCKDHEEHERIHAHKVVLAARSPVFQAMFFGPCADGKDEVQLDKDLTKILDLFLRYIYCDTVNLTEDNASSVLEMAHYYQVSNLVQFCADYLATIITPDNACKILTLALRYEVTTLRNACSNFIDRNADKVLTSDGFLELSEDCLTYILKGDTFYTNEDNLFKKAEEWSKRKLVASNLEKNGQSIRKTLGTSFYYLRLPTMEYQTFSKCTRKKGYFSIDEHEDIVDFINEFPGSQVKSNSCVTRLASDETLLINNERRESLISGKIATTFRISVSRDVNLTNFLLCATTPYLKYDKKHFTDQNCKFLSFPDNQLYSFVSKCGKEVIKFNGYSWAKLQEINGEELPNKLVIEILGNFKVTCLKEKLVPYRYVEAGNPGNIDRVSEEEAAFSLNSNIELLNEEKMPPKYNEVSEEILVFDQDFQSQSSKAEQKLVKLREPLKLTKADSPYTVKLALQWNGENNVKMKTSTSSLSSARSKYGCLEVENIEGHFAGIKSLGFENFSNRDTIR